MIRFLLTTLHVGVIVVMLSFMGAPLWAAFSVALIMDKLLSLELAAEKE